MGWYFRRGAWTVVTVPLLALLVATFLWTWWSGALLDVALLRVLRTALGPAGLVVLLLVWWVPLIIAPVLVGWPIIGLPVLWQAPATSTGTKAAGSLALLVALPLAAQLIFSVGTYAVSWLADRNPCAALAVGVTGDHPPEHCP